MGGGGIVSELGQLSLAMAQTRLGRTALACIAGLLALLSFSTSSRDASVVRLVAGVVVAIVLIGAAQAWLRKRRRRKARVRVAFVMGFVALAIVAAVGGVILLLARRKDAATTPIPGAEEIDAALDAAARGGPVTAAQNGAGAAGWQALLAIAGAGVRALAEILPGALARGLAGGFTWGAALGLLGALGGAVALGVTRSGDAPTWLVVLQPAVMAVAFACAGAYAGAVRAALAHVASQMEARGVVRALYALLRPAMAQVARRASAGGATLGRTALVREVRDEVWSRLARVEAEETDRARRASPGPAQRLAMFMAQRGERLLVIAAIGNLVTADDPDGALAQLEGMGLPKLEATVGELLRGLFSTQVKIAFAAATAVGAAPILVHLALR
jgi:hypothetical protein